MIGLTDKDVTGSWVKDMMNQSDQMTKNCSIAGYPSYKLVLNKSITPEVVPSTGKIYVVFETKTGRSSRHSDRPSQLKMTLPEFETFQAKLPEISALIKNVQERRKIATDGMFQRRVDSGWKQVHLGRIGDDIRIWFKWHEENRFSILILEEMIWGVEFALCAAGVELLAENVIPKLTNAVRMWQTFLNCCDVLIRSLTSTYDPVNELNIKKDVNILEPVEFEELAEALKDELDKISLTSSLDAALLDTVSSGAEDLQMVEEVDEEDNNDDDEEEPQQ
jgi:hypothetical protein